MSSMLHTSAEYNWRAAIISRCAFVSWEDRFFGYPRSTVYGVVEDGIMDGYQGSRRSLQLKEDILGSWFMSQKWTALGGGGSPANHSQAGQRPKTRQPIRILPAQFLSERHAVSCRLIWWRAPTSQWCPSWRHVANNFTHEIFLYLCVRELASFVFCFVKFIWKGKA